VPHANPRFAKLAFGRGAIWPLIEEAWTDLCEWTVHFVGHLQLARQPDLAFIFLMLNGGEKSRSTPRRRPTTTTGRPSSPSPRARRAPSTCSSPLTATTPPPRPSGSACEPRRPRAASAAPTRLSRAASWRRSRGRGRRRRRAPGHWLGRVGRPLPARRGQPASPAAPTLRRRGAPAAAPAARGALGGPHRARRGALAVATVAAVARARPRLEVCGDDDLGCE
jgi:hypothetical protein